MPKHLGAGLLSRVKVRYGFAEFHIREPLQVVRYFTVYHDSIATNSVSTEQQLHRTVNPLDSLELLLPQVQQVADLDGLRNSLDTPLPN